MATKSKNRILLISLILLFSFGLNGIFAALFHSGQQEYFKGSYFETGQFNSEVNEFIRYLGMFELDQATEEEAKKAITVTQADIEEHRNRYGPLQQQIADIHNQYEFQIQNAMAQNNKQLADTLTAQRDKKIEDITNNFKSDDYVRPKVVQEKEQQIEEQFRQRENYRPTYLQYKAAFKYYIKDISSGKVYTNLDSNSGESADQPFSSDNAFVVRDFPATLTQDGLNFSPTYSQSFPAYRSAFVQSSSAVAAAPAPKVNGPFEGKVAVLKSAPSTSSVMVNYFDFKQRQTVVVIYTIAAIIACFISVYLFRRTRILQSVPLEKWAPYAKRIPLDVMTAILAVMAFVTFVVLVDNHPNYNGRFLTFFDDLLSSLFISAFLVMVTYINGIFLIKRLQDTSNLKAEWQSSLIYTTSQGFSAAFMNRSIAVQVFLLLVVVFFWGLGTFLTGSQPNQFMPAYLLAVLLVGLPTLVILIRRIGYFNRIVKYATELAAGNYQADLPAAGKSVLAQLAGSLNALKSGVKTSQKEQAKSERLKTELITNVSHDLRTPLTSVITYTELLKNPELSAEDRESYIQIIDRKAKRLKVLIDDLFEASKMASGNIELSTAKADLVQLLQQTLAEHNEEINKSTLHLRIKTPDAPVYAIVDGQRLWRVFDNLIGNILKYALENTRVYITFETVKDKAIISFKNVTKYELSENVDELFERFKRGDTSRHTDGSGLGLAIAKSIVDLHAGSMDIEVDGDLFKVTVTLPRLV